MPLPLLPLAASAVVSIGTWLANRATTVLTVAAIIAGIILALKNWWCLLLWYALNFGALFANWLEPLMPEQVESALEYGVAGVALANKFVPLDMAAVLLGAYWTFSLTLTAYRVVKSWIPTVSG